MPKQPKDEHNIRNMHLEAGLTNEDRLRLNIIYPSMQDTRLLNIYREVRNKILRLSNYNNFVCLVSSLDPGSETSLLALNLAAVFAFDKSRSAIVVDCDTDENLLDELTRRQDNIGLIDFIENEQTDVSLLIHNSGIERLRIVPAGNKTETRTESLESVRMREIVLELKSRYPDRYIFINAPNMKLSSEVQILSNVSDMVIFELPASVVDEAQLREAVEMIGAEKIAGIVFKEI